MRRILKQPRRVARKIWSRLGFTGLLMIGVPLLIIFLWLRLYGLPEGVKDNLLGAIERHHVLPYPVSVDRFRLDATGAILADGVTVFRDTDRRIVMLQVDQVRVSIAWLDWWRGRGFIDHASIAHAEIRYPVGPELTADFREVNADVAINDKTIRIESAQARLLQFAISVRGTIHNDGFPKAKPPTVAELRQREAIWRSCLKAASDLGPSQVINVRAELEISTREPATGRANFAVVGRDLTWRGAPVPELSLEGSLTNGVVDLDDVRLAFPRGDLTAFGEWNMAQRSAELQFSSSLDFTTLAPAFPGTIGRALGRLQFPNMAPGMTGRILFDLRAGVRTDLQADLDWRDFLLNGVTFSRLTIPLAYDGKRLLIPGLTLEGQAGNVNLDLFFDSSKGPVNLQAKINSTLDPTVLKGVAGEGLDRFLASCSFPGGGPVISATATGSALKTDAWKIEGKLQTGRFIYKNASFETAVSSFKFLNSQLELPDLQVTRPEGKGGGSITYDFKDRFVVLHNLVTQVDVSQVAPIMGPKFTEYTKPYKFTTPPLVHADGRVDLQDQKHDLDTNLTVRVEGRSPMEWTIFHVPFSFDFPNGVLLFKNRDLAVDMQHCGFYGGQLDGKIYLDLRQSDAGYKLDLNLNKVNFNRFMVRTFGYGKSTGSLVATGHFEGHLGNMQTLGGKGEAKVDHGQIAQIPFLGSLTPLIPGLSEADAAHAHFTADKGKIHTTDLHISSETLALLGSGEYDFTADELNLDMRVNTNVPMFGLLLYPVSKIFEFNGTGHMKDVKWAPKNL